jgi:hypothetical protein
VPTSSTRKLPTKRAARTVRLVHSRPMALLVLAEASAVTSLTRPRCELDRFSKLNDHGSNTRGPITDVVVWRRSFGLGKYEAVFRDITITEKACRTGKRP